MDISNIIVKYVDKECNGSVFHELAAVTGQVANASLVLIAESFQYSSGSIATLSAALNLSDSDERNRTGEPEAASKSLTEFDLHTLGVYCDDATKSVMENFKQHVRKENGCSAGWIRRTGVLSNVCRGETLVLMSEQEVQASPILQQIPTQHPVVKNAIAMPLFDLKSEEVLGVLAIANFPTTDADSNGELLLARLKPIVNTTQMILSSHVHQTLKEISTSVVDHIQVPIIVFRRRPCTEGVRVPREALDLVHFHCFTHNKAFTDQMLRGRLSSVIGYRLFQCFPQLEHTPNVLEALLGIFSDHTSNRSSACLEAVDYEDMLVPRNTYTIKFCEVDENTFICSVENISDQIRAKVLAEEIAQAKEQFVANVSHEIRTPLNGIMGYISMMSDPKEITRLSDYQRNCLSQIKDCSMSLLYIMNDILDFSKLNADQMKLHEEAFEVTDLLEKSYDVVLPTAHDKGLEMAFFVDPNVPPRVKGDFKKLRQILLNLLSNGVKFTHRGRVDTTVKLIKDPVTNDDLDVRGRYTVEFCVQDSGIGISARDLRKLFKPFSQIDQSDKKIYQGTGLGLIISKKLIELMGGSIRVESSVGEGSKFIFDVKLEEARSTSPETQSRWLPILKDRSVLIVDDHATNRITISTYLLRWGMKPVVCSSGEEALMYVRGGVMPFDFALIDMRMPKMDGNSLAVRMKQLVPDLPLIAISSAPVAPEAIDKGFSFYLTKPIKYRQLFNVCVAVVKKISTSNSISIATKKISAPILNPPPKSKFLSPDSDDYKSPSERYSLSPVVTECQRCDRSVLIAEDLYTNQQVAIGFLEKLGFKNISIAEDGIAALDAVKAHHYDIILMDLKMPRMDGFEASKRIRSYYLQHRSHEREPFIIAVTANAMSGVREKCADAGMDAYITKPIDMKELASLLNDSA